MIQLVCRVVSRIRKGLGRRPSRRRLRGPRPAVLSARQSHDQACWSFATERFAAAGRGGHLAACHETKRVSFPSSWTPPFRETVSVPLFVLVPSFCVAIGETVTRRYAQSRSGSAAISGQSEDGSSATYLDVLLDCVAPCAAQDQAWRRDGSPEIGCQG